jgi:uncharacterized membrane protein
MMRRFTLFGHPVHPPVTHFALGILPLSLLWMVIAAVSNDEFWWKSGFWCMIAGLVMVAPAAVTGLLEYLGLDRTGKPFEIATWHLMVMLSAACLFGASAVAQGGAQAVEGSRAVTTIALAAVGTAVLLFGGWLGGELVHRYGAGQTSLAEQQSTIEDEALTRV